MRNHHTTFESDELLLTLRTVLPLYKDVENPQVIMWIWDLLITCIAISTASEEKS